MWWARITSYFLSNVVACLCSLAVAGVPVSETISKGKWQRVNDAWTIDTEDVEIKRDKIRFGVKRNAIGNEEMSTQALMMTWTGKLRIRCGDFHTQTQVQGYFASGWVRITPDLFAYELASNFCYLTNTPGFTPEPIIYAWQDKITTALKKQLTPGAIKKRREEECTRVEQNRGNC